MHHIVSRQAVQQRHYDRILENGVWLAMHLEVERQQEDEDEENRAANTHTF